MRGFQSRRLDLPNPQYRPLFKELRTKGYKPLSSLEKWNLLRPEKTTPWKLALKETKNCVYLLPKYRQLLYYIVIR